MMRSYLVIAVIAIQSVFSQSAFADGFEDCKAECGKKYSDCIERANKYVNDIEIQDAKEVCDRTLLISDCESACVNKEINHEFDKPAPKETGDDSKPKSK